jgi:hypothetical protein
MTTSNTVFNENKKNKNKTNTLSLPPIIGARSTILQPPAPPSASVVILPQLLPTPPRLPPTSSIDEGELVSQFNSLNLKRRAQTPVGPNNSFKRQKTSTLPTLSGGKFTKKRKNGKTSKRRRCKKNKKSRKH